jgi:hypothetical protein
MNVMALGLFPVDSMDLHFLEFFSPNSRTSDGSFPLQTLHGQVSLHFTISIRVCFFCSHPLSISKALFSAPLTAFDKLSQALRWAITLLCAERFSQSLAVFPGSPGS